jgi:hypothetical protein
VGIAVYDSVMAIDGGYRPFAVDVDAPPGSSAQAAVVAAANRILVHYLAAQKLTILDPAYVSSLATIPDGTAKTDGIAVGEEVADLLIAQRADDGFRAPVTYTPPNPPIPGVWIPTAPTPPIARTPGSCGRSASIRPTSSGRADRRLSTARSGRATTTRSRRSARARARPELPRQTVAARFWGEAPVQQAHGAFRKFVLDHDLDVVNAARFMAMVSVVDGDALIACFDAKYHYAFWRPITAIRAGDTDGNPATIGDPAWSTLLAATPNHPEYPSAHSCITPASGRVIARFLGTNKIDFTVPSLTGLGDRHFDRVRDLQYEVSNARIWGGIHYRTSVEDGIKIAKKTAHQVLAHHFQRVRGHDDDDEDENDDD